MAIKRLVAIASTAFLISLLFSLVIVQSTIGTILETRKTAIIKRLSRAQLEMGAFHPFYISPSRNYFNEYTTALALSTLKTLNALDKVDVESAVDYVASTQHPISGGFGAYMGFDRIILGDMYTTYNVVHTMKEVGALSKLNQTALLNFVMARYNQSPGAFSELVTEFFGRKYAFTAFDLGFRCSFDLMATAYAIPNVITTFAGISILAEIGALNLIDTIKTLEFIMTSKANNGLFKPYPTAQPFSLSNPFDVDSDGTGIPYTYTAISTLEVLKRLDVLNQNDREKIKEYILSCQSDNGNFYIHKDYDSDWSPYTFYALMTLTCINMQDGAKQAIFKVQDHISDAQNLRTDNQWPIPQPQTLSQTVSEQNLYGLFQDGGHDPLSDTANAVSILNMTEGLLLLDQTTPRAVKTELNLVILSAIVAFLATVSTFIYFEIRKTRPRKTVQNQNMEKV